MSLRFVFCIVVIFASVVHVIDGCNQQSGKPKKDDYKARKGREVDVPIIIGESGFELLLRPRNPKEGPTVSEAEEVFRSIDANSNGMIDAAEWVDFSKKTSVWDFVEILDYADTNNDEAVSLAEFLSVQIAKIDHTKQWKDDVAVPSS